MAGKLTVRADRLLLGLAESVVRKEVEPRLRNAPLWDAGIGDVVETAIQEGGVSSKELSMVDLARAAGILKRRPSGVR
jgi:hypothetical protein